MDIVWKPSVFKQCGDGQKWNSLHRISHTIWILTGHKTNTGLYFKRSQQSCCTYNTNNNPSNNEGQENKQKYSKNIRTKVSQ